MASVRCLLIAALAAVGDALQQPTQVSRETEGAFREVTSKMDELHQGLAKIKQENLNAVSKAKAELDSQLVELTERNRKEESINVQLAADIKILQESNIALTNESKVLMQECRDITAELKTMQSNISMAQEFISRSVILANVSLHGSPEIDVLAELDSKDSVSENVKHHEKRLHDLEDLAGEEHAMMLQLDATQKEPESKDPGTQDLLKELLTSWTSISGQQLGSIDSLKIAFEKEKAKSNQTYETLLQEQTQLNATKHAEESLNAQLQGAVAHLKVSRDHLAQERVSLQTFAKRLGWKPVQGTVTPPPVSLDLPESAQEVAATSEDSPQEQEEEEENKPSSQPFLGSFANRLKSTLR